MRNIFDQYTQQENRLTHALVIALSEDKKLCRRFLQWILPKSAIPNNLHIIEQQLVGEPAVTEAEAERRGLPDAWVYDESDWSLLIESKVKAALKKEQLIRHLRTAERRGFGKVTLLTITVEPPKWKLPAFVRCITWADCFEWLVKQKSYSSWSGKVTRYMEVCESNWAADGYLTEGTLTKFTGIPFSDDYPYNYREAKLYLKQAMEELRKKKPLGRQIGAALDRSGRGAITGKTGNAVWDYIPFKDLPKTANFTAYPHLTFFIDRDVVGSQLSVPNSIQGMVRKNLKSLNKEEFQKLIIVLYKGYAPIFKKTEGAYPFMSLVQRHYKSQRSNPTMDARLEFDLRTAVPNLKSSPVKFQSDWVSACYQAINQKKSNLHLSVGIKFPFSKDTDSVHIIEKVTSTWLASKPMIDFLLKGK